MKYTNHLQKPTRLASLVLALIVSVISMLPFKASAEVPEGDPLFEFKMSDTYWNKNMTSLTETYVSDSEDLWGVKWESCGFQHELTKVGLLQGATVSYEATLMNATPLLVEIGRISALLKFESEFKNNNTLEYVKLLVSENKEMTGAVEVYADPEPVLNEDFWTFQIPEPKENYFYKLCIKTKSPKYKWINLYQLNFYAPQELAAPVMDENMNTDKTFSIVSNSGELHLIASEYDKNGKFIKDVVAPSATESSIMKSVTDDSDASWRNKVADQGVSYTIAPPENKDNFTVIRAKSVYGEEQSPELYKFIHDSGIITGVESIFDDSRDASEQWYNLQGTPVENPTNGVFIRVAGSKATKVRL